MATKRSLAHRQLHRQEEEDDKSRANKRLKTGPLPHPKPLLAPELDLLRWITEMREKLRKDGALIGGPEARYHYLYNSLRYENRTVIRQIHNQDRKRYFYRGGGRFKLKNFYFNETLLKLESVFRPELENQRWIKSMDAKPGQRLHLLDLPPEIIICIAEWCHLQPRRVTSPWSNPSSDSFVSIGGGLDRLSRAHQVLRDLVAPILFSYVHLSCDKRQLAQALDGILDLKILIPHVRIDVYESDTAHTWAERFFAAGAVGVSASAGVAVPDALLPTDYDQSAKLLVSTLKSMDGLREFSFSYKNLKEDFPAEFSNLVRDWKLCLPRLTGLRLVREEPDSPLEYPLPYALANMCPNLERAELEFDDIFGTRQVPGLSGLGDLPRLLEIFFTAGGNELTNANVRTIVETFPQLRRLGIDRTLGTASPESLVPILSSLPDLEFLAITDDPGTHDPVTDENRHMSKEDRRLLRQKLFAENLFIQCRKLRQIYLEWSCHQNHQVYYNTEAFIRRGNQNSQQHCEILHPCMPLVQAPTPGSHDDEMLSYQGNYEVKSVWNETGFPRLMDFGRRPFHSMCPEG